MEKLYRIIEELEDEHIAFWKDICRIESKSCYKDKVNRVNDCIESMAKKNGFEVLRIPFEGAGDYMIIDLNPGAEKGYMFLAHTDTVFEDGVFGEEIVTEKDGRLYGPGVIDCKGGIAIALLSMKALSRNGYKKNIRLVLVSDEEVDNILSVSGADIIRESAEGYQGVFCCEVGRKGKMLVERKGILRYEVIVHGKSAHSGINYFSGRNAIYEAAKKISAIQELSCKDGVTYSCNIINAGTAFNIIPDVCSFFVDIRVKNEEQMKEAEKNIERIAATDYTGETSCEVIKISNRIPMKRSPANDELFEKIRKTSESLGLEELVPASSGGGSDAAYTASIGVPTVCAAGTVGDFCHTAEEYAEISSLVSRAKILSGVIDIYTE